MTKAYCFPPFNIIAMVLWKVEEDLSRSLYRQSPVDGTTLVHKNVEASGGITSHPPKKIDLLLQPLMDHLHPLNTRLLTCRLSEILGETRTFFGNY